MRYILVFLCVVLLMVSCKNEKKQMVSQVQKLEKEVDQKYNKEKVGELIISYDTYMQKFPKDSMSKGFMIKGTEMSILNNDPLQALKFIDAFLLNYPADPKAPLMQFKKGMVFDLLIHDPLRAVAEYDICIRKYPESPVRQEAENAILLIQDPLAFTRMVKEKDSLMTDNVEDK